MAIGARRDQDVGRERRKAAGHRPHVQVVHLDDVLLGDERAADRLGIGVPRCPFEKDERRLSDELGARPEHEHSDREARDRVEPVPPRREDQTAGEGRGSKCSDVRQDVEKRAPDVEALAAGPGQYQARGDTRRHTNRGACR